MEVSHLYTNDLLTSNVKLPEEKNMLPYLMRNVVLKHKDRTVSIKTLIDANRPKIMTIVDESDHNFKISLPLGCRAYIPTLDQEIAVSSVSFKCKIVSARVLKGVTVDPFLLQKEGTKYEYKDLVRGTKKIFSLKELEIGFDNIFNADKFYFDPKTEFSYYCEKVENGVATMYLVESYQHGL